MQSSSDSTILSALKQGDEKAFAFLIDKFSNSLFGYAFSLANDKAMAKDILQNVFMKVWEKRDRLQIDTSLKSYLFRSTYNEFINQYKKNNSTSLIEQKYHESLHQIAQDHNDERMQVILKEIYAEIDRLSPKCREIFLLSRKDGLTNKEIAQYLDVSVKNVEAQITKAFKVLKKNLGPKFYMLLMLFAK